MCGFDRLTLACDVWHGGRLGFGCQWWTISGMMDDLRIAAVVGFFFVVGHDVERSVARLWKK